MALWRATCFTHMKWFFQSFDTKKHRARTLLDFDSSHCLMVESSSLRKLLWIQWLSIWIPFFFSWWTIWIPLLMILFEQLEHLFISPSKMKSCLWIWLSPFLCYPTISPWYFHQIADILNTHASEWFCLWLRIFFPIFSTFLLALHLPFFWLPPSSSSSLFISLFFFTFFLSFSLMFQLYDLHGLLVHLHPLTEFLFLSVSTWHGLYYKTVFINFL